MRRFFGFLLTMALLGGGVFWLPYLQAEPVDNVYQAADLLRQDAENGGNGVAFREDNVDADEVYRALEAQVRELQRLLGKKAMENELLREAVSRAAGPKKLLLRSTSLPGDGL